MTSFNLVNIGSGNLLVNVEKIWSSLSMNELIYLPKILNARVKYMMAKDVLELV